MPSKDIDLIHGFDAIADHLGITPDTARRRAREGKLPTFHMGSATVYARPSELDKLPPVKRGRPPCEDREERAAASNERRLARRQEIADLERLRKARLMSDYAASGLLYGARAIAAFLGITERMVYHRHEEGQLPTFKLGRTICARRHVIAKFFHQQEGH